MNTYLFFSDDRRDRMKNRIHHLRGARSLDDRLTIVSDILNIFMEHDEPRTATQGASCADLVRETIDIAVKVPDLAQLVLASDAYYRYTAPRRALLAA